MIRNCGVKRDNVNKEWVFSFSIRLNSFSEKVIRQVSKDIGLIEHKSFSQLCSKYASKGRMYGAKRALERIRNKKKKEVSND